MKPQKFGEYTARDEMPRPGMVEIRSFAPRSRRWGKAGCHLLNGFSGLPDGTVGLYEGNIRFVGEDALWSCQNTMGSMFG